MSINNEIHAGYDAAGFDAHGIEPVPARHRTSSPFDQFWIWTGANIAPINWVLGALGIQLGLSLLQTLAVIVIGNLLGAALFGTFCIMGYRTAAPQMVLSRLAFGRRGAYLPALAQVLMPMGWVAINTWIVLDLCIAAFDRMGLSGGPELRYLIAAVVMVLQIGIAAWGFNAIKYFERYTMPLILLIMAAMTVLAFLRIDIQWSTSTTGGGTFAAASQLMTAIGIGWGISWLAYASDYTRFTKPTLGAGKVFRATFLGMFLPTVWLAFLGAAIASGGAGSDPSKLVVAAFGVMALPVLLVLLHGPIATNIVVIYSAALSSLAMDIRWPRWIVSVISGVIASVILYFFLQSGDFAHAFDNFMVAMVVWVSPWAGVTLADFFLIRRGRVEVGELYAAPDSNHSYGDVNWAGLISLALGLVAAWAFQMGTIAIMQGPFALATGGVDLSWLTGMVAAGASYLVLHPLCGRPVATTGRPLPIDAFPGDVESSST